MSASARRGPSMRVMADVLGLLVLLLAGGLVLLAAVVLSVAWGAVCPRRETAAWAIARGLPADPADAGLEAEAWTLRRPDGVELAAWTIRSPGPFEPGRPRVPLIVLAHGWYRGRRSMLRRLPHVLPLADRVVLYDARGHGESGGRSTLGIKEPEDLLAVADAAAGPEGRAGTGPAILVGWSLGATAAIVAASRPEARGRIAGVVAVAPVADLAEAVAARLRQFDASPWMLLPPVRIVLRCLGAWPPRPEAAAEQVAVPVLVVHGERDEVCPLPGVRRLVDRLSSGRLLEVPGAGHEQPEATAPEAFGRALEELVGDALAGTPRSC
jgi:pimeloyl-ACP methyl ester carboxylesterase